MQRSVTVSGLDASDVLPAVYLENWIHELNHTIYLPILPVEFFPVNLAKFTIDFSENWTMM